MAALPTVNVLSTGTGTANQATYGNGTNGPGDITFAANRMAVAIIAHGATVATTPTVTTTGLTWTRLDGVVTAAGSVALNVFTAPVSAANTSNDTTFDFTADTNANGLGWVIVEIANTGATAGTSVGSYAVKTRTGQTSIDAADDIPTFESAGSITVGFMRLAGSANTITADAAWTNILDPTTQANPNAAYHAAYRAAADTHWAISINASSTYVYVGLEILPLPDSRPRWLPRRKRKRRCH